MGVDVRKAADSARRAAESAADVLRGFAADSVRRQKKDDGSLVTEADLAAEKAILDVLRTDFPDLPVLSEEAGEIAGARQGVRWIVDPLDGTHRFARGHDSWGPLIALEEDGRVVAGAMALPMRERVYWAGEGEGAYRNGVRLRVSGVDRWEEAILSLGALGRLLERPCSDGVLHLARTAEYVCAGGDLGGAALVLEGQAEAWIETGVKPWDIAPMQVIAREAGGHATDLSADPRVGGGRSALVLSNGRLHDHVLRALGVDPP